MTTPGRLRWRDPSGLSLDLHRLGAGWGITATWPHGRGGGAARDTRDAALAAVPELIALCCEGEARRVGRMGR